MGQRVSSGVVLGCPARVARTINELCPIPATRNRVRVGERNKRFGALTAFFGVAFFFSAAAAFFLAFASLFPCGARWVMEGVVRQNQRTRFKQQL